MTSINRRELLAVSAAGASTFALANMPLSAAEREATHSVKADLAVAAKKVRYCLNTSTIRAQKLGIEKEIELAAAAGYDGIEPWIRQIEEFEKQGGKLSDLKKKIADAGLTVESAIGFARWIVDDEEARKQGLEQARRDMDLVKQIGGSRIAAPPTGATRERMSDLFTIADRYGELLKVGENIGVAAQLEVWGFSKTLSRLGETIFACIESGHKDACLLPDVYHIYKGGSDFTGLNMVNGAAIHCFHMNDYPAEPARNEIGDKDRVYPGDGVAPLNEILRTVLQNGFQGALSIELFNPNYWKQEPAKVVQTSLAKMKSAVERAVS